MTTVPALSEHIPFDGAAWNIVVCHADLGSDDVFILPRSNILGEIKVVGGLRIAIANRSVSQCCR